MACFLPKRCNNEGKEHQGAFLFEEGGQAACGHETAQPTQMALPIDQGLRSARVNGKETGTCSCQS